ncbi:MAG: FkbM family methyltransferase [Planctomycetales bacterium]|nr:FkbM family methyltransferase [Planctomycetales bacterium]
MSWQSNSVIQQVRRITRRFGINSLVARILLGKGYEARYDRDLSSLIRSGDIVWDIGANQGMYTTVFSQAVGRTGHVYAFEPSEKNYTYLSDATKTCTNVTLCPFGLADRDGEAWFAQGEDNLGATSRISEKRDDTNRIEIRSGDALIKAGAFRPPNVVKVDVEGFETEVLRGLSESLRNTETRAVGVEVHFGILEERGQSNAAKQIEKMLCESGFQLKWSDPSHLVATRAT